MDGYFYIYLPYLTHREYAYNNRCNKIRPLIPYESY